MSGLLTVEAVMATQERAERLGHPPVPLSALATFVNHHATEGREALVEALTEAIAQSDNNQATTGTYRRAAEAAVTALVGDPA